MKTAIILAGGLGTRLRPLTETTPKPLLPIAGRPTLEWTLELLHKYGFKKAVFAVGYRADLIQKHFGSAYKGMEIVYSVEKEPLGTGGPLKLAAQHLTETFLVINGDNLVDINLVKLIEHHKNQNALATIALTEVEDPSPFGVAVLDGAKIRTFVEKPPKESAPSNLINAGVYVMEPGVVDMVPADKFCSLEKELFPGIAEQGKMAGLRFDGAWFPTDTVEKYAVANAFWKGYNGVK